MNYYDARQRAESKRWDYTCRNDGEIWPTGYCAGTVVAEHDPDNADRYHDDGHDTEEEARACYKRNMLDKQFNVGEDANVQRKCKKCGEWTNKFVEFGHAHVIDLCDEHATREVVDELTGLPGQIMSSY